MNKLKHIWTIIKRYKYLIVLGVFALNLIFFDENNIIVRINNNITIKELREQIRKYNEEYEKSTKTLESIKENPQSIEKVAREKYYMKKENEDIYIIK